MKKLLPLIFSVLFLFPIVWRAEAARIVSRQIIYNDPFWDDHDININSLADAAIATDKSALLPSHTSTFTNFTNYNRGINGIMINIAGLEGLSSLLDFGFLVGNLSEVNTWTEAPTPTGLAVRSGEGASASDRVTIIWSNDVIVNQRLQVNTKTTLGISDEDIFYFGNLVGDVTDDGHVSPIDSLAIINDINNFGGSYQTDIQDPLDINRDGYITALDGLLVNNILNNPETISLVSFTAPQAITPIPEPTTMLLLGAGLIGLAGLSRKKFFNKN